MTAPGGTRRATARLYVALGLALALIGVTAIGAAAQSGGGSAKDPLKLFEPMMPVLSHPRCANCHGAIDVVNGVAHDQIDGVGLDASGDMLAGQQGNSGCLECHDEDAKNSVWRLAPGRMAFVGKDSRAMCRQLREDNGLATGDPAAFDAFLRHLSGDQLIGFAFEGKRAMTENDVQAPPLDRGTFVDLARHWLQEGKARCGPWNGSITQTIAQKEIAPLNETIIDVNVVITVKDGDATALVHVTGHQSSKGQACYTRTDTLEANASDLPVQLNVIVNRDLSLAVPSFQPSTIPSLPPGAPPLPPGVNIPPNPLSNPNGYSFVLVLPQVQGIDKWEERNPPGCGLTTGQSPYTFKPAVVTYNKSLPANDPGDHLVDGDVVQQGSSTATTVWDLSRE